MYYSWNVDQHLNITAQCSAETAADRDTCAVATSVSYFIIQDDPFIIM